MTAELTREESLDDQPGRRIVGWNPGLSAFCVLVVVGSFVFSWTALASPPNDASNLLNVLPPLCLVATVNSLLAGCRIVVDSAGFIDVIGPVLVRRIPVADVVAIEHDDGLRIRLVSGRRIGSTAYATSLLGVLLRYPRSRRAAARILAAIGGLPVGTTPSVWRQDSAMTKPRIQGLLFAAGVDVALVLGTVVLNAVLR